MPRLTSAAPTWTETDWASRVSGPDAAFGRRSTRRSVCPSLATSKRRAFTDSDSPFGALGPDGRAMLRPILSTTLSALERGGCGRPVTPGGSHARNSFPNRRSGRSGIILGIGGSAARGHQFHSDDHPDRERGPVGILEIQDRRMWKTNALGCGESSSRRRADTTTAT